MNNAKTLLTAIENQIIAGAAQIHPAHGVKVTEGDAGAYAAATLKLAEQGLLEVRNVQTVTTECFGTVATMKVTTFDATRKGIDIWLAQR